jgi:hypothetical protein
MRLSVLDSGHSLRYKLQMRVMSLIRGATLPDVVRMLLYRREFFGKPFGRLTHHAIQESPHWSIGECELFAAFVSRQNHCPF